MYILMYIIYVQIEIYVEIFFYIYRDIEVYLCRGSKS